MTVRAADSLITQQQQQVAASSSSSSASVTSSTSAIPSPIPPLVPLLGPIQQQQQMISKPQPILTQASSMPAMTAFYGHQQQQQPNLNPLGSSSAFRPVRVAWESSSSPSASSSSSSLVASSAGRSGYAYEWDGTAWRLRPVSVSALAQQQQQQQQLLLQQLPQSQSPFVCQNATFSFCVAYLIRFLFFVLSDCRLACSVQNWPDQKSLIYWHEQFHATMSWTCLPTRMLLVLLFHSSLLNCNLFLLHPFLLSKSSNNSNQKEMTLIHFGVGLLESLPHPLLLSFRLPCFLIPLSSRAVLKCNSSNSNSPQRLTNHDIIIMMTARHHPHLPPLILVVHIRIIIMRLKAQEAFSVMQSSEVSEPHDTKIKATPFSVHFALFCFVSLLFYVF